MLYKVLGYFISVATLLVYSDAARILAVLPVPLISHQMVFRVLTHELVKCGHEVVIITGLPIYTNGQAPANYTEIDIQDVTDAAIKHLQLQNMKVPGDLFSQFVNTFNFSTNFVSEVFKLKNVQNLIRQKRTYFDLIFLEDCFKSALIFSHIFKAPVIQISSFGGTFQTFEAVGAATHPILFPLAIRQRYHNLSVFEKISEMFLQYRLEKAYDEAESLENEVLKKHFGKNTSTLSELRNNIHMVFINIHPIWDSNRPVPPNVIYLGGLHQKTQEELPEDLKSSLDSSVNGVIYVSFGTSVDAALLSPEKLQIFVNVFSKLPYDVFWKWDNQEPPGLSDNIKVLKWYPQSDLLMHPNVKLFITQGGLQSTDEAISAGVPLIAVPILWDQWFNANKYLQLGIGLYLNIKSITENNLNDAIKEVIADNRYKHNIMKLRSVIQDQKQSPLDRAVWWTEYVIRHKGSMHLRAPSANMSWIEYYEVKLIGVIFVSVMMSVMSTFILISRMIRIIGTKIKTD